jgi:hypothetical protein
MMMGLNGVLPSGPHILKISLNFAQGFNLPGPFQVGFAALHEAEEIVRMFIKGDLRFTGLFKLCFGELAQQFGPLQN